MRVDDFRDSSAWTAVASGLATLALARDDTAGGPAMRLDFDFHGGLGFVVARRTVALDLPECWDLRFRVRGRAPANRLELKLCDPSGRNVWWWKADPFVTGDDWRQVAIASRDVEFAWGPAGGGAPAAIGAIEIAVVAGPGGRGTLWLADLEIEDRTVYAPPVVRASSAVAGHPPEHVLDARADTSWRSVPSRDPQWLSLDFQAEREYGGLVVHWERAGRARAYTVRASDDGVTWQALHAARDADTAHSWIPLAGRRSRHLRLDLDASVEGGGFGIADLEIRPFEFSRSVDTFFRAMAAGAPRGAYPRYLSQEQAYWSPAGLPDGETCALLNEDGLVEVDRGTFSIEPFLQVGGRLVSWADAAPVPRLERGWLPIPSSVWTIGTLRLHVTAFATRSGNLPVLWVRYRLEHEDTAAQRVTLFAACRPFQVTPPWQAYQGLGGVSPITSLDWTGGAACVNGSRLVLPLTTPDGFGAAGFEQGSVADHLGAGALPPRLAVSDASGWSWGALRFDLDIAPGDAREVFLAVPFGTLDPAATTPAALRASLEPGPDAFARAVRAWEERLGGIDVHLPGEARDWWDVARTATGHVLVNRDGPALQPGPRRYTRAWIRDGAIMAAALLRMGRAGEACAFVRWYAPFQADDGTVPCAVDRSGPDWLVEHDSHGELIVAVADCWRFTGDAAFLAELWPAVARAARHIEALRATRLGPAYDAPDRRAFRGLLPESASHEGYLAQPVHAYWDDFWGVRALGDAAAMAAALGEDAEARRLRALRDDFRATLRTSIDATIAARGLAYVPGSVEWADFDPTATANALTLLEALDDLPRDALDRTFDEYLAGLRRRRDGQLDWNNYSAYEIRIIGAMVRLGRRDDAHELARFFLGDRRPRAWNQWPEISWRDPRSPGHLGDVPHAWIGAEYVLALRSMLVFERDADQSLVVAAGVPGAWLDDGGEVRVRDLPTAHGPLAFRLRRRGRGAVEIEVGGTLAVPAGGIVLRPPLAGPLARVEVDGVPVEAFAPEGVALQRCPARAVLSV